MLDCITSDINANDDFSSIYLNIDLINVLISNAELLSSLQEMQNTIDIFVFILIKFNERIRTLIELPNLGIYISNSFLYIFSLTKNNMKNIFRIELTDALELIKFYFHNKELCIFLK